MHIEYHLSKQTPIHSRNHWYAVTERERNGDGDGDGDEERTESWKDKSSAFSPFWYLRSTDQVIGFRSILLHSSIGCIYQALVCKCTLQQPQER